MKQITSKKLVDLSHTIEDGLVTYKGLPAPIICDFLSREASKEIYDEGTTFQMGVIEMCSNTGTYLDSPFHRYQDGKDLSQLKLEQLANLEVTHSIQLNRLDLPKLSIQGGETNQTIARKIVNSVQKHITQQINQGN